MRANQEIRVAKVLSAVKWLRKNHRRWKDIDYNTYQTRLENFLPTIIDHSEEVASQNQNVEQEELFSCYYPDGTMNNQQGGLNNPEDFKRFIDDMHQAGFKIELQVELGKKFLPTSPDPTYQSPFTKIAIVTPSTVPCMKSTVGRTSQGMLTRYLWAPFWYSWMNFTCKTRPKPLCQL